MYRGRHFTSTIRSTARVVARRFTAIHEGRDCDDRPSRQAGTRSERNAGRIFVNIEDKNEIAVIDSTANKLVAHYPSGAGTEPAGLGIEIPYQRVFAVCGNKKMEILDVESGKTISEVAIGAKPDSADFDGSLGLAFISNGDGTLTVVKEDSPSHLAALQHLATKKGARTMAYDPVLHQAYLVTAEYGAASPATIGQATRRPPVVSGSFQLLVAAPK
jgi:hypothetical protein